MTLPPETVMLRVDYGEPEWREKSAEAGYADLTHDGALMWIKFDGLHEIEMKPKGARVIAAALLAFADMMDRK